MTTTPEAKPIADTIAGNWAEYRGDVLPLDLTDDEMAPMEAAFLAGTASAYEMIRTIASKGADGQLGKEEAKLKLTMIGLELVRLQDAMLERLDRFTNIETIGGVSTAEFEKLAAEKRETQVP